MEIRLTEVDRRDLARHARTLVNPALPRKVRELAVAKLVIELTPRLKAQRLREQEELIRKWAP